MQSRKGEPRDKEYTVYTCTVCGYERTIADYNGDDDDNDTPAEEPEEGLPVGAIVGIVAGSVVIAGAAVALVYQFVIKKRK